MMKLYIVGIVICCLAAVQADGNVKEKVEEEQITKGKPPPEGATTNATVVPVPTRFGGGLDRGSASFRVGHCSGDQQVYENVLRHATPYLTKRLTYTWDGYGYYRATCIKVINRHPHDGATVKLLYGGVHESYVVLDLISAFGGGMNFDIEIWAVGGGWY